MAGLASLPLRPLMFGQRGLPVRALVIAGSDLLVASLAGVGSDVLRRIDRMVRFFYRRGVPLFVLLLVGALRLSLTRAGCVLTLPEKGDGYTRHCQQASCCPHLRSLCSQHRQTSHRPGVPETEKHLSICTYS